MSFTTTTRRRVRQLAALTAAGAAAVAAFQPAPAQASVPDASDFTAKVAGVVYDVAQGANGKTFIGGTFTGIGSQVREGVGAVNKYGYADAAFAPDMSDGAIIYAVEVSADLSTVYIGGLFTSVNGVPRTNLAALDATTGAVIDTWQADALGTSTYPGAVRSLEVKGDRLYVGGAYNSIDGRGLYKRLAALDLAGNVITGFKPAPSGTVRDIAVAPDGESLYAVGGLTAFAGVPRMNGVGQVLTSTGALTPFDPTGKVGGTIAVDLSPDGTRLIYSGGNNSVVAVDPAVSNDPVWISKGGGDTQAIAISPTGEVYVGGHFTGMTALTAGVAKIPVVKLASLNLSDGTVTAWRPPVTCGMGPWSIELSVTQVEVGGECSYIGGRQNGGFGRFSGTP